jgi:Flp pilus assembly protein TadG
MPMKGRARPCTTALGRALDRLRSDRRGATAVEFAILALPFVFMIFAILELALVFMVNVSLDNAVAIEGRKFRTGQECISPSDTGGVARLTQNICNNMSWLQAQCPTKLFVDIRSFSSFSGATSPAAPTTVNAGQTVIDQSKLQDTSGGSGTINVLTAYYEWPLLTPFLYGGLQTLPGSGQHLLISTEVMSFEPFGQCTQPI